jgi:hypothetical protein
MGWTWLVVVLGVAVDWLSSDAAQLFVDREDKTRLDKAWHGPRDWQLPSTAKNPLPYRCLAANHQQRRPSVANSCLSIHPDQVYFYFHFSPQKDPEEGAHLSQGSSTASCGQSVEPKSCDETLGWFGLEVPGT